MRILAIHGVGHADARSDWQDKWREAIVAGLARWNPQAAPEIAFLAYDDLFEAEDLGAAEVLEAFARLTASGLFHGIGDLLRRRRGLGAGIEDVRWSAGMVAQWVALESLREKLRARLGQEMRRFAPDAVLAHSLGSLIAYDTFRTDEVARGDAALIAGRTLMTFGSQIGNPAVRSVFGGRVEEFERARFWWHLYNEEDAVFTCPITLPAQTRFRQVDTYFDLAGIADHDGDAYLGHPAAGDTAWQDLAASVARARSLKAAPGALAVQHMRATRRGAHAQPTMRALLVGIADYADPANRLEGPVNDVFRVSASLQELGFPADGIRVVLNERATAAGIRERLAWLLGGARPGDHLVFYFAGHGAQVPGYGRDAEVDRVDECLVPYDFDWSAGRAITDDEFAGLYSQLPYEASFTAILDCCHSGGMARAAGARARGLTPPDDIRHRMLRWDRATQMWLPRARLAEPDPGKRDAGPLKRAADREAWTGKSGSVRRLGRATSLWSTSDRAYRKACARGDHFGPYTPILLEACREGELAYEYRHGVTAHGAFTYALTEVLRAATNAARPRLTFEQLIAETARRVASVVAEPQHPQLHCAAVRRKQVLTGFGRR